MKDLTGRVFTRLTVLRRGVLPQKWLCRCICGVEREILRDSLVGLKTKSCGCWSRDKSSENRRKGLSPGDSLFNVMYQTYKRNAKMRSIKWCLSVDDVRRLFAGNCAYCGIPPATTIQRERLTGAFTYNGIDRKDNSAGYEVWNTVSCCKLCNYSKRDSTVSDFVEHANRIHEMNAWPDSDALSLAGVC